ncbi:MAG: P-loop NTPase [Phycisphaeraceae bacterium]|nr:MAG: P-loop NTPase [Phycisphaeraceae bacterium]
MSVPPVISPTPVRYREANVGVDQAARLRSLAEAAQRAPAIVPIESPPEVSRDRRGWPGVIAVGSGKGGVGKTALSVNLAIALSKRGLRVTVVDGDLGTANIDVVCGLSPSRRLDLLTSDRQLSQGVAPLRALSIDTGLGFRLVPGAAGVARVADGDRTACHALVMGLGTLGADADIVVVDAGAGIGVGVRSWMHAADVPLIVATPEPAAIADAYGLMKALRVENRSTAARAGLVLNQVGSAAESERVVERLGAVVQRFLQMDLRTAGTISWDRDMVLASRTRRPLLSDPGRSRARRDIVALSQTVAEWVRLSHATTVRGAR